MKRGSWMQCMQRLPLQKREKVMKELESLQKQVKPILATLEKPEVLQQMKQDRQLNLQYLVDTQKFQAPQDLNTLSAYAKFMFEIGKYEVAADALYHLGALHLDSLEKTLDVAWGKLASEILTNNWETAWEELMRLRDLIETNSRAPNGLNVVQQVQQRAWLLHWSLFVFFNHPKGRDGIVDLCFTPAYLNAIQTACPHLLRYLTAAVITNKRRRSMLKELVKVIQQELYAYRDPITDFLHSLYTEFDFDSAQKYLAECEQVLQHDYFLAAMRADFLENARYFMFESYCRIHKRIDIRGLSQKLNLGEEEGERWIVNLVRNARLDAKIDSQEHTVVMGTQFTPIYQDLIEKAKDLAFRSHVISSNMDKKEQELKARLQQQQLQAQEAV